MAWLPGYAYRKPLVLTGGASGAQTDFQLDIDIAYVAAKMQADFDDIRFTQNNGTTLIDAWLESKVDSASAETWAEFPTTPANTVEQTYYMYYGNAGAANYWDGAATFQFFDDLPQSNGAINGVNGWVDPAGGASGEFLNNELKITYPTGDNVDIHKDFGFGSAYIFDLKVKRTGTTGDLYIFSSDDGGGAASLMMRGTNDWSDNIAKTLGSWSINTWYDVEVINPGSTTWALKVNGATIWNDAAFQGSTASQFVSGGYQGTDCGYFDDFRVRKYAANPPTYAFGAEESAPIGGNPFWYYNMLRRRNQ